MKNVALQLVLTSAVTLFAVCQVAFAETPDPRPWSFFAGSWITTDLANSTKHEFHCSLNEAKTCYMLTSKTFPYQGTLGIDLSNKSHPMLALAYHAGDGYSIGHLKRESPTKVSGTVVMHDNEGNEVERAVELRMTKYGFDYYVDNERVGTWEKKKD